MELLEAQKLALTHMNLYGLIERGWTFKWLKSRRTIGLCCHSKQFIGLSITYARSYNLDTVQQTVLHEIAHALLGPEHGHDETWRQLSHSIGGDTYIRNPFIIVAHPYEAECPRCGATYTRGKKPSAGRIYFCRTCGREGGVLVYSSNTALC